MKNMGSVGHEYEYWNLIDAANGADMEKPVRIKKYLCLDISGCQQNVLACNQMLCEHG